MNGKVFLFVLVGIFCSVFTANSQNLWSGNEHLFTPAKNYISYKTTCKINIDGKADEQDWQQAEWSELFQDIEGSNKALPLYNTRVKMLWDESRLYIFTELEEQHVWAYYLNHDMIVYHENDFEVFIDPDRDTHNYYEFEVNAQNTLFDLFMDKPYRNGGHANIAWNAKGFKSAVYVNGTINNPNDTDKTWTVEMAIPFAALTSTNGFIQPTNGDVWKINFSRVQWHTETQNGKYTSLVNPETRKHFPEDNWVWSPQGIINMHYPERWGMVQFSQQPVGSKTETFRLPQEEQFAKYLWLVYYKQQKYRSANGEYATTLSELGISKNWEQEKEHFLLSLNSKGKQFSVQLKTTEGLIISINQDGLVKVLSN